jgi:hypothetical protein
VNRALLDRHEQLTRAVAQQQIKPAQRENEEKRMRPVTGPQDSTPERRRASAARTGVRHRLSLSTTAQGKNPDLSTGQNNERLKPKSKTNEKPVAPWIQETERRKLRRQDQMKNQTAHSKGKIDFSIDDPNMITINLWRSPPSLPHFWLEWKIGS